MDDELVALAEKGEAALQHYGVKGMKWGVRNAPTKTKSSAKAGFNNIKVPLSTAHKRIVVTAVGTGAAVATTLLAGPVGGMAVSAMTRAADISIQAKDRVVGDDGDERR